MVGLECFLRSPFDGESCKRTSKFSSSANLASRILVEDASPVLKSSVDMAWEWRSRARWDILWAWARRWMCRWAGVDFDEKRMYVDTVSQKVS